MDDATFLRNLAAKGRVTLLADGTAVPAPRSVLDDESRAGAAFIIDLISPEATESGDGRTFKAGTISHRDLPLPLMWQWQLDDGHKGAIIVGRIDYIEETPDGLGNARGVFDSGPWGREAERLVRGKFLRGVSGDYTNFKATILPDKKDVKKDKAEAGGNNPLSPPSPGEEISDDQIMVTQSRLVSATLVSKPAFEGCYIRIPGPDEVDPDEYEYQNGEISAPPVQLTASLLLEYASGDTVERLRRLEAQEQARLSLIASAAAERIAEHRLRHEREAAIARMRDARNVTAAFGHFDHNFLSAKAKMQPRDKNGRFIEMGSLVRWAKGSDRNSGFHKGKVDGFDPNTKLFKVKMLDGNPGVTEAHLPGNKLEVVKALIPKTPEDAKLFLAKPSAPAHPHLNAPQAPGMKQHADKRWVKNAEKVLEDGKWLHQKPEDHQLPLDSEPGGKFKPGDYVWYPNGPSGVERGSVIAGPNKHGMYSVMPDQAKPNAWGLSVSEKNLNKLPDEQKASIPDNAKLAATQMHEWIAEAKARQAHNAAHPLAPESTKFGSHSKGDTVTFTDSKGVTQTGKVMGGKPDGSKLSVETPDGRRQVVFPDQLHGSPSGGASDQKSMDSQLAELEKSLQNSPEAERLQAIQSVHDILSKADQGPDGPTERLQITSQDGNLTKTFHNLGLDSPDFTRASDGQDIQQFERKVQNGYKPSAQEWKDMNNTITSFNGELDTHEYDQMQTAWNALKALGGAPHLPDHPEWPDPGHIDFGPPQAPNAQFVSDLRSAIESDRSLTPGEMGKMLFERFGGGQGDWSNQSTRAHWMMEVWDVLRGLYGGKGPMTANEPVGNREMLPPNSHGA